MKEYLVTEKWEGYSRGTAQYLIHAESEEEARDKVEAGGYKEEQILNHCIVRSDIEGEVEDVRLYVKGGK